MFVVVLFYIFIIIFFSVAPEISEIPEGLTTVEGRDVVFSCVVEGNPSPNVTWTKNKQRLNVTGNSRLTASSTNNNYTLTVTDVHRSDAGQYRCVANNSVNTSTSSAAKLEVHCKYHKCACTLEPGGRSPRCLKALGNARMED